MGQEVESAEQDTHDLISPWGGGPGGIVMPPATHWVHVPPLTTTGAPQAAMVGDPPSIDARLAVAAERIADALERLANVKEASR